MNKIENKIGKDGNEILTWQWYAQRAGGGVTSGKSLLMIGCLNDVLGGVKEKHGPEWEQLVKSNLPRVIFMASELGAVIENEKKGVKPDFLVEETIELFPQFAEDREKLTSFAENFLKISAPLNRFENNPFSNSNQENKRLEGSRGFDVRGLVAGKLGLGRSPVLVTPEGIRIPWSGEDEKGNNLAKLSFESFFKPHPGLAALVAAFATAYTGYMTLVTSSKLLGGGEFSWSGVGLAVTLSAAEFALLHAVAKGPQDINRSGDIGRTERVVFALTVGLLLACWVFDVVSTYKYMGPIPENPIFRAASALLISFGFELFLNMSITEAQDWLRTRRESRRGI